MPKQEKIIKISLFLRDRLMAGHMTLNHVILVRIQVPQPQSTHYRGRPKNIDFISARPEQFLILIGKDDYKGKKF